MTCRRGHDLADGNLYFDPDGRRRCICRRIRGRKRKRNRYPRHPLYGTWGNIKSRCYEEVLVEVMAQANDPDFVGDLPEEFWHHIELVLGHSVKNRASSWSCSC